MEENNSSKSSDIVELDGFASFGDGLGFSLIDEDDNTTNIDSRFELLNEDSNNNNNTTQISGSGNEYKSEKKKQFDNDYEEMMKSRGSLDSRSGNTMGNQMNMRTF